MPQLKNILSPINNNNTIHKWKIKLRPKLKPKEVTMLIGDPSLIRILDSYQKIRCKDC